MNQFLKENDKLTWSGIVPGRTSFETILGKLGAPDDVESLTNGKIYHFHKGKVQVTLLSESSQLRKIFIAAGELGSMRTLKDFEQKFGAISEKYVDKTLGPIYERAGVRIATDFASDPPLIRWIELF